MTKRKVVVYNSLFFVSRWILMPLFLALLVGRVAEAEDMDLNKSMEQLEKRVNELEFRIEEFPRSFSEKVQIRGLARARFGSGEDHSAIVPNSSFEIHDALLYIDADVARDFGMGKDLSFFFEFDAVREGRTSKETRVGEVYIRMDSVFNQDWLNFKFGRFQIPFGEEYLYYTEGTYNNPLANHSVANPYGFDEGLILFGDILPEYEVFYIFHVSDGDNQFNADDHPGKEYGLKLSVQPTEYFYLSASVLNTGGLGSSDHKAESAFEWGGTHAVPVNGQELDSVFSWEVDVKLSCQDKAELWVAYGSVDLEDGQTSADDRDWQYWIIQGLVNGTLFNANETIDRLFAVVRFSAIGTFESDEGYVFVAENGGDDLGFNTEYVSAIQLGCGYHLTKNAKVTLEYDIYDFNLIDGASAALKDLAGDRNAFLIDLAVRF